MNAGRVSTRPRAALVSILLLPVLFALDRYLSMGVAVGVLYVIPVLLTLWSPPRLTLIVATLASLLVAVDVFLSLPATVTWIALLNRAFALAIIWLTTMLVHMRQNAEHRTEVARADLERKVVERTAHLDELNRQLQREAAERLQVAAELRDSTERFRAMVETTSDWVWELDAQGVYTYASPKGLDILGYAPEEVIGRTMMDFMPTDEAERFGILLQSIFATRMAFRCVENVNLHRDGHRVVLETSGVPMFGADGVFRGYRGIDRDVSERKDVEHRLRESEQHLRQIIDLVPHRICVKDADGRFLLVNQAAADAYGLTVEAMTGRSHGELHTDMRQLERMLADDRAVIERGEGHVDYEESFTGSDQRLRALRTTKIPYWIPERDRPAVLCMAIDITEEKQGERRLIESEQKYRALLENAVDAILLADAQGNILDANRRAEDLLGYTHAELCRMHASALHPPHEHESLKQVFQTLASSGSTLVEHDVVRKDGTLLRVEVAAVKVCYGDGGDYVLQGIFRDITERERRSKERLAQEQQHRDTLVREVHHRIKNNLQGVVGLLREQASAHPELTELIATAIGQVQSISVVYGLHGQGEDMQVRLCDMVGAIARNASTLTRTRVEPQVQLAIRQPVQVNQEEAVPVALVVNELILNAIKHGAAPSGRPEVRVIVDQQDDHAAVRVICAGRLPDGFDYPHGKGLGTGLALVRSLLPHHGAELSFVQTDQQVEANLRLSAPVVQV